MHRVRRLGSAVLRWEHVLDGPHVRRVGLHVADLRQSQRSVLHGRFVPCRIRVHAWTLRCVWWHGPAVLRGRDVWEWTDMHVRDVCDHDGRVRNGGTAMLHGQRLWRRNRVHERSLHRGTDVRRERTAMLWRQCMQCGIDVHRGAMYGAVRCHGPSVLRRECVQRRTDLHERCVLDDVRGLWRDERSVLYRQGVQRRTDMLLGRSLCRRRYDMRRVWTTVLHGSHVQCGTRVSLGVVRGRDGDVRQSGTVVLPRVELFLRCVLQWILVRGVRTRGTELLSGFVVQLGCVLQRILVRRVRTRGAELLSGFVV